MDPVELRRINAQRWAQQRQPGNCCARAVGLPKSLDKVTETMNEKGDFRWSWREGQQSPMFGNRPALQEHGLGGPS